MLRRLRGNRRVAAQRSSRWTGAGAVLRYPGWRRLLLLGGSLALSVAAALALGVAADRAVGPIIVQGQLQRVSELEVATAVRKQLGRQGLMSADLAALQRALRRLAWVDDASVSRRWPNQLVVRVVEQTAVARWGSADLINARGERFLSSARFIPPELPRLLGASGSESQVVARYLDLQARVVGAGLRVTLLEHDARGAWSLQLDNGVEVRFGRKVYDERLARFLGAALPLIAERAGDIAYVDMRYGNGFAVGWRTGGTRLAARFDAAPASAGSNPDV